MGGCLSSKLIITRSLSQHTRTTILPNSNSNNNPHPPPSTSTSTHHLLALLRAVNNLPKPPPPPAHQPCIREDDPPSPLDHNSYGDQPFTRSFHTVEEYDALLETHHHIHNLQNSHDNNVINSQLQNSRLTDSDTLEVSMMRESNGKVEEEEEAQQHGGGGGSKRKRVGKGLGLLQLPPTVTTLTLGGQVYSPGLGLGGSNYVTPKFGSYNVHVHVPPPLPTRLEEEDDNGNTNIIDPDLVAAFDQCMLQLQLEQDNLIKQIDKGDHPF